MSGSRLAVARAAWSPRLLAAAPARWRGRFFSVSGSRQGRAWADQWVRQAPLRGHGFAMDTLYQPQGAGNPVLGLDQD